MYNITFDTSSVPGIFAAGVTASTRPTTEAIIIVQLVALITAPTSGKRPPINVENAETNKPRPSK